MLKLVENKLGDEEILQKPVSVMSEIRPSMVTGIGIFVFTTGRFLRDST
jgi:hypothetical protein